MKTQWLDQTLKYDGKQLEPLSNYLVHGVLGDSIVGWQGPCDIPLEHIVDGEDLRDASVIKADQMLHFVLELFQFPLSSAVLLQRLMGDKLIATITASSEKSFELQRRGDDVFWGENKLNISIATCSSNSSLIHYGINVINEGTPVPTAALSDFSIVDIKTFAQSFMQELKNEVESIQRAMVKVRSF